LLSLINHSPPLRGVVVVVDAVLIKCDLASPSPSRGGVLKSM